MSRCTTPLGALYLPAASPRQRCPRESRKQIAAPVKGRNIHIHGATYTYTDAWDAQTPGSCRRALEMVIGVSRAFLYSVNKSRFIYDLRFTKSGEREVAGWGCAYGAHSDTDLPFGVPPSAALFAYCKQ